MIQQSLFQSAPVPEWAGHDDREREPAPPASLRHRWVFSTVQHNYEPSACSRHTDSTFGEGVLLNTSLPLFPFFSTRSLSLLLSLPLTWRLHPVVSTFFASSLYAHEQWQSSTTCHHWVSKFNKSLQWETIKIIIINKKGVSHLADMMILKWATEQWVVWCNCEPKTETKEKKHKALLIAKVILLKSLMKLIIYIYKVIP